MHRVLFAYTSHETSSVVEGYGPMPSACLFEDGHTGRRWLLADAPITLHSWVEAESFGALGMVRTSPLRYVAAEHVAEHREVKAGNVEVPERWWINHAGPLLPSLPLLAAGLIVPKSRFANLHVHSEFCLAPDTRVVTADMVWKPIGDVSVGEVLVGFDEDLRCPAGAAGRSGSKMRRSEIIATKRVVRDCYRINLADGSSVVASAQHGWVVNGTTVGSLIEPGGPPSGYGTNTRRWVTTQELASVKKARMIRWATPWSPILREHDQIAGWLAGVADGEGWLHDGQFAFGQNPGPVMDEILRACRVLGYSTTELRQQSKRGACQTFRLAGYETVLRFLSQCDPVRFRMRWDEVWVGRRAGGRYSPSVPVISVNHIGDMETVALTTSTKTFIAEGFLSHNSPLDGLATIEELVDAAVADEQEFISVTDHGYCAAHPQLAKIAKAAGIKPIFGIEANLVNNRFERETETVLRPDGSARQRAHYWHFIMLAMNDVGLRNLWAASSEAHITGFWGRPRMDWSTLERHSEGIIASTACLRGPVASLILSGDIEGAAMMLARLRSIFPDRLYVELHANHLPDQLIVNRALVDLAARLSLPTIVVADSHYACRDEQDLHQVWIAVQTDKDLDDDQELFAGGQHYHVHSTADIEHSLDYLPKAVVEEAMRNTIEIGTMCTAEIRPRSAMPVFHRHDVKGTSIGSGVERDVEVLRQKVEEGFAAKVAHKENVSVYRDQVERELDLMVSKGFAGYFLIVDDYCLDPSTPVLTEDLRWVEIGKMSPGDKLAGFDEDKVVKQQKGHRYWRSAEVVSTRRISLPTYRVVLADGTETVCSEDHRWLVASPSGSAIRWVRTRDLLVGQRPQRLTHEWDEPNTWEAGYIAGILDGEGSLSRKPMAHGGHSLRLSFAQLPGPVLDTALRILAAWGFDCSVRDHGAQRNALKSVYVRGGRSEILRLLGMVRPMRLLEKFDIDLLGRAVAIDSPSIISIEPLGVGEVVALETTTGTLVAQGFAHHNCGAARSGRAHPQGKKILMGPGRGSVVGSLVAYLLGITKIDPIEADLMFERFLTPGRTSPPDIDLDFPSSERDSITGYTINRWGEDRVVRVGTHGRLKNKGVIQKVAKALGSRITVDFMDLKEISRIITAAEAHTAGAGLKWDELWEQEGDLLEPYRQKYPEIFEVSDKLVKRLASYGRHASGIVIDPEESIVDRLPLRTAGSEKEGRQIVTEFDFEWLEFLGFLKFDFLTLRTLDTIQQCVDLIADDRALPGISIDIDSWVDEYEDPQVWDMLCEGDTLGVFQIETSEGSKLVRRMQPRSIADLSAILTLVRPGPMRSGLTDSYLRRRFGQEEIVATLPEMEAVLGRTYQCLAAETEVITRNGTMRIKDLHQALGEQVMDGNGRWVDADVRWFGQQALTKITLRRNKQTKDIFATADHRWFARWSDSKSRFVECTTDDLRPGMILRSGMPNTRVRADRTRWTVVSVETTERVEDVYCAVVPTTASFVLADHILTGNCMIYQEDIMGVCQALAGYDLAEADKVRAILGKKKVEEAKKEGRRFIERCKERGLDEATVEHIWSQMEEFAKYCVTGDTKIMLAGAGQNSDGWMDVADAYRRLHVDPPSPWRAKFRARKKGVFGMAVHPDGRIRKCRILDVQPAGMQRVVKIVLENGMSITATPDHRHLTPEGLRCVDDGLAVGDMLIVNGGYERDSYTPERDRTTVGERVSEGAINSAFGDDNYGYINGGFASLSAWTAQTPKVCAECGHDGSERRIERAHLDGDRQNNEWSNLRMLCSSCHKKFDYEHNGRRRRGEKGLLSSESRIVSISDEGVQMTYDVMMDEPHVWIANGIATTNTFNRAHAWSYAVLAYWCIHGHSRIYDWDNDRYITVAKAFKDGVKTIACYDEESGFTVPGRVKSIVKTGRKDGIMIRLRSRKALRCSPDHKILTPNGWMRAGELSVGDLVAAEKRVSHMSPERRRKIAESVRSSWAALDSQQRSERSPTISAEVRSAAAKDGWDRLDPVVRDSRVAKLIAAGEESGRGWFNRHTGSVDQCGHRYSSSNEHKVCEWLNAHEIEHESQVFVGGRPVDFVVQGVYIEFDGVGRPESYFDEKLGDLPYIVVRPGDDLDDALQFCLETEMLRAGGNVIFEPIIEIEDDGESMMYDIEMDGEIHNFLANGVVVHNCAWLKCHFPAHFLVAVLSTVDKARIPEFVELARRNGFSVSAPDVNDSQIGFSVSSDRLGVRYGFSSIPDIGTAAANAIIESQPYSSWDDFVSRRGPACNWGHIKKLAAVGTFDSILPVGQHRAALERLIEQMAEGKAITCVHKRPGYEGPNGLPCAFPWETEVTIGKSGKPLKQRPLPKTCSRACRQYHEQETYTWPRVDPLSEREVRERERTALGVYLSSTPFDIVSTEYLDAESILYGFEAESAPAGNHVVFGMVQSIRKHVDRSGNQMAFLRVNSRGYELDLTCFSKTWFQIEHLVSRDVLALFEINRNSRGSTLSNFYPIPV